MSDLYIVYVVGQNVDMVDDPDVVVLDDGLYLVRSGQTRSQLYHVIKRRTSPDQLLVAPLADLPKFKGMKSGSLEKARRLAG
ncbi:hypothetical protein [Nitrobacter sp. TKz-YC01]|uniref:hypothetical protein n=1 Tax=Nitrobacter sp. TKz-YC01 TaxID=3398703 RepID=UPI003A0FF76D